MKALLQRVSSARVEVDGEVVGAVDHGLLVLLGVEKNDGDEQVKKTADKLLAYRIFADEQGRMNNNVVEAGGGLLIVSQFTLVADTSKGLRPSFSSAAAPDVAQMLYESLLTELRSRHAPIAAGKFGANMQVHLINDGPVTFLLEC